MQSVHWTVELTHKILYTEKELLLVRQGQSCCAMEKDDDSR